jgi:MFS family permease
MTEDAPVVNRPTYTGVSPLTAAAAALLSRGARRRQQPSRRNFWLHILGGGGLLMAIQFGNPQLVLPWISHHLGVAYILVALLVPMFQAGMVVAELTIAPQITRLSLRKRVVAGSGLLLAGLFALIFGAAAGLAPSVAALALLFCAASYGVSYGVFSVANTDLLAKTVAARIRGKVLIQRAALGGVLTLAATFTIWALLPGLADDHLVLLWLAAGAWLGAAAAYGAILELPSASTSGPIGKLSLGRARAMITDHPWFARLLTLATLQQSIEMAIPFYAVHAASLHDPAAPNLSAFVVAVALGLVLSGPVWGRLIDRHNALVIVIGAMLTAGAGALVLIMGELGDPAAPFYHALLFVPLSLARQGVSQARTRRLTVMAPADDRTAMVAFSSALVAFTGVITGLILGAAGHLHDIRTPLVMLILCNVATALYVRRAFADQVSVGRGARSGTGSSG